MCVDISSASRLGDARRRGLLRGRGFEVMLFKMRLQLSERLVGRVGPMKQLFVLFGNRAPLCHRLEVDHLLPVLASVQDDRNLLRQLVGLRKRQNLEELVARAKST